jgi:hypothetical protein
VESSRDDHRGVPACDEGQRYICAGDDILCEPFPLTCSFLSKWRHFQEVITGHLPFFNTAGDGKVVLDVINGKRPERPSASFPPDDIWTLIQSCWVEDVDSRPGISSILSQLLADCCEDKPRLVTSVVVS